MGREGEVEAAKIATHIASAIIYHLMFHLDTKPDNIAEFIRVRFLGEHVKVAVMHSSCEMESGMVALHQTSDQNNDDNIQDMVGEDWINILILEGKVIVDIDAMDSGVIVDHNDNIFLSSVNTMGYTTKNTMAGVAHINGKATMTGFKGAKNLTSTPMDQDESTAASKWGGGPPQEQ